MSYTPLTCPCRHIFLTNLYSLRRTSSLTHTYTYTRGRSIKDICSTTYHCCSFIQEVSKRQRNTSVQHILKGLYHETESLADRFPYKLLVLVYFVLLLLSVVRWLALQQNGGSEIPPQLQTLTYTIWLAYQGVCYHWLYVMVHYLSCIVVIQKSFSQIWRTVKECSMCRYPLSVFGGICFFTIVALAIASEILRCNLSTSKWTYNDWSPILGIPLMAVHAAALICQGLY